MDLQDPLAKVRLKFFLATQVEGRIVGSHAAMHLPDRPAGILAALALMEHYSGTLMKGEEIRSLFKGLSASGLSNVVRTLNAKSLVEVRHREYRVFPNYHCAALRNRGIRSVSASAINWQ